MEVSPTLPPKVVVVVAVAAVLVLVRALNTCLGQ